MTSPEADTEAGCRPGTGEPDGTRGGHDGVVGVGWPDGAGPSAGTSTAGGAATPRVVATRPTDGEAPAVLQRRELSWATCLEMLRSRGVGRIAVSTPDGPQIYPANYTILDEQAYFRLPAASSIAAHVSARAVVALQADRLDEEDPGGWTVQVRGAVHRGGRAGRDRARARGLVAASVVGAGALRLPAAPADRGRRAGGVEPSARGVSPPSPTWASPGGAPWGRITP